MRLLEPIGIYITMKGLSSGLDLEWLWKMSIELLVYSVSRECFWIHDHFKNAIPVCPNNVKIPIFALYWHWCGASMYVIWQQGLGKLLWMSTLHMCCPFVTGGIKHILCDSPRVNT
jgi:hypothetical protein